jgi:hypothetical protein
MAKLRVYIVQFISILLLLCFYFLDVQEDKGYDMHFNIDSSSSYIIKKPTSQPYSAQNNTDITSVSSKDKNSHKFNLGKNISFKIVLPQAFIVIPYTTTEVITYTSPIPESYDYLFFREINPPPPKQC